MIPPSDSRSFRPWLQNALTAYANKPIPLQLEDNSAPYVRAIVSTFNRENKTRFSVLRHGKMLLVGLRHDCQSLIEQPIQQLVQPEELIGIEQLYNAIEKLRDEGVDRDTVQSKANGYIMGIFELGI
jgi:hypothetical protein